MTRIARYRSGGGVGLAWIAAGSDVLPCWRMRLGPVTEIAILASIAR